MLQQQHLSSPDRATMSCLVFKNIYTNKRLPVHSNRCSVTSYLIAFRCNKFLSLANHPFPQVVCYNNGLLYNRSHTFFIRDNIRSCWWRIVWRGRLITTLPCRATHFSSWLSGHTSLCHPVTMYTLKNIYYLYFF